MSGWRVNLAKEMVPFTAGNCCNVGSDAWAKITINTPPAFFILGRDECDSACMPNGRR